MSIVINPTYGHLRAFIEQIPETFAHSGEVIYDARNQIRRITYEGQVFCVKRYRQPSLIRRLVYSFLRSPKAVRAFDNARQLQQRGIATPEAVAYILCRHHGLLAESYLVTLNSNLKHTFYDFRDGNIQGKEDLITAFAHFTARMHNAGVLHLDYSPGNILYDRTGDGWQFELVDINRLRLGTVSPRQGCTNLCRLWGKNDFFEHLAPIYAAQRHIDPQRCLRWIQRARRRFWAHHRHDHFVSDGSFSVGVIISTYNNPQWLEKVLWGLIYQTHPAQEVIIADDGSNDATRLLIERYRHDLPIRHVWHEDKGFRKTTILNRAVLAASADYLIFIDQDLIPRRDFIQQHYLHARRGHFLSGGAVMLPEALSHAVTREDIRRGDIFRINWLLRHGMHRTWKMSKLCSRPMICSLMNRLTTTKASWNGGNASTWREYILRADGFDTRMRYGAEDREFGQRLENSGITGIQIRYHVPLMHLYHQRPYRNQEDWNRNKAIWDVTRIRHLTRTDFGISNIDHEP